MIIHTIIGVLLMGVSMQTQRGPIANVPLTTGLTLAVEVENIQQRPMHAKENSNDDPQHAVSDSVFFLDRYMFKLISANEKPQTIFAREAFRVGTAGTADIEVYSGVILHDRYLVVVYRLPVHPGVMYADAVDLDTSRRLTEGGTLDGRLFRFSEIHGPRIHSVAVESIPNGFRLLVDASGRTPVDDETVSFEREIGVFELQQGTADWKQVEGPTMGLAIGNGQ